MKLSDSTLLQVLLGGGDIMTLWQVLDNLFTNPTSIEDFGLRIAESPFEVGHGTLVGCLLTKVGRVVDINLVVGTA
jgi:hypothetical protein